MSRHILAVFTTVAIFLGATAVAASAQDPYGPPPPLPPCQPGQMPSYESPCMVPPCAEGQAPTPASPCMIVDGGPSPFPGGPGPYPGGPGPMPGGPGPYPGGPGPMPGGPGPHPGGPGQPMPCGPGPDGQPTCPMPGPGGPGAMGPGAMDPRMLSRVWRFDAEVGYFDAEQDNLNVTVLKIVNLPKGMAAMDDEVVDQDAYVVFSAATRVYDASGKRVPKEIRYDALLDNADRVQVSGKLAAPAKWKSDEDDNPVVTIRAKRVKIVG